MPDGGRTTARLLAPLALVLVVLAFLAIVLGSGSNDGERSKAGANSTETEAQRTETDAPQRTTTQAKPTGSTYTVKVNDTLGGIAEETGVSVETLLELNPDLDPQALVSGQKIKLRE